MAQIPCCSTILRFNSFFISPGDRSGAYDTGDAVPGGVIADAFYPKGRDSSPELLLRTVADLIETAAAHAVDHKRESAPVWIPRNGKDSHGIPFVVLTCTDCLRSFPLSVVTEDLQKIQGTPCLFCPNTVRYIIDFSLLIASPLREDDDHVPGIHSAKKAIAC